MSFADDWHYVDSEPEILLFTHCLKAWRFDIKPGDRVLELGCCETDFARRLKRAVPDLHVTGLDVRDGGDFTGDVLVVGDAADPETYRDARLAGPFDWVISLGAIEHFGLGWYGDPKNAGGDKRALRRAVSVLKPGGGLYFDVPWSPLDHYETAHYRCYSDATVEQRLRPQGVTFRARGWVPAMRERDEYYQVRPMTEHPPFYFLAQWGVKTS